ncbi:MAG: nucleotidyltransferase domain-containing protein [Patescibacteria group bacterium]
MSNNYKKIPKAVRDNIASYIISLEKDNLPIEKVVLFGSYAKGTQHQWSDIDLCIVSPKFRNAWQATQYLWSKRINDIGLTIEPVGFSPVDYKSESPLLAEIKRTGIRVD